MYGGEELYVCSIYRIHGGCVGRIGTSVLYIGCMVPMWGGSVRLSYIEDAWCLKVKSYVPRYRQGKETYFFSETL